jgi:hypothetical protein
MRERHSNGRFKRPSDDDHNETRLEAGQREGFVGNLLSFLRVFNNLWTLVPFFIILFLMWKYFRLSQKISGLAVELVCGEDCFCQCPGANGATKVPPL